MAKNLAGPAFQALGDANRRAIVEELGKGERSVVELTRRLRISHQRLPTSSIVEGGRPGQ